MRYTALIFAPLFTVTLSAPVATEVDIPVGAVMTHILLCNFWLTDGPMQQSWNRMREIAQSARGVAATAEDEVAKGCGDHVHSIHLIFVLGNSAWRSQ